MDDSDRPDKQPFFTIEDLFDNRPPEDAALTPLPTGIHKPITGHAAVVCQYIRETEKALLVRVQATEQDEWFPLSQISYIYNDTDHPEDEYPDTIHAAKWLLDKKRLRY